MNFDNLEVSAAFFNTCLIHLPLGSLTPVIALNASPRFNKENMEMLFLALLAIKKRINGTVDEILFPVQECTWTGDVFTTTNHSWNQELSGQREMFRYCIRSGGSSWSRLYCFYPLQENPSTCPCF